METSDLLTLGWNSPPTAFARRYRSLSKYDEDHDGYVVFDIYNDNLGPKGDLDPNCSTSLRGRAAFTVLSSDDCVGLY